MKRLIIVSVFLLIGCSVLNITTKIETPTGEVYTVNSKSDALVTYKRGDTAVTVDNRGRMSAFESVLGIVAGKTELNLSNKEGR